MAHGQENGNLGNDARPLICVFIILEEVADLGSAQAAAALANEVGAFIFALAVMGSCLSGPKAGRGRPARLGFNR